MMSNPNGSVRCFLCRQKNTHFKAYKMIDVTTCPASKKEIRHVLKYLAEISNIELHVPRNEWICCNCFFQISEYDAYLVRTVKKQQDLLRLVEKALVCVDSDFDEECENEMIALDNELQNSNFFDDLQVSDEEINAAIHEAVAKKRKRLEPQSYAIKRPEVFQCSFCAMTFKSKTPFQKHMNQIHKKYNCELCEYSHRNEDYVLLHMNLHEGRNENQCRYCEKEFTTKISTIRHMEVHLDTKKYQCDKCGLCFSQTTILYNHKLQHEAEEKPLRCEICNQLFKTKRTFRHHLITHRSDRPRHTCEICGRNFTEKYTLKVHKRTHHEDAEFTKIEERTNEPQVLVPEIEVSTTEPDELTEAQQQQQLNISGSDKSLCCIICDQPFLNRDQMNKHMEKDHDVILKSLAFNNFSQYEVVNNEAKKSCHLCGQMFCMQSNLDYHIENVHGASLK